MNDDELDSPESTPPPKLPKPRRRKVDDSELYATYQIDGEEPAKPARRKAAAKPKTPSESASKPARKAKESPPAAAKAKPKPTPKGKPLTRQEQIQRAISIGRKVIRLAPLWLGLLIVFFVFGPGVLRSIFPWLRPGPLAPLFTREVQHWAPHIIRWAEQYETSPNLVATLMQIESCGYPGAASYVGAQGLFQVMPFNFQEGEENQMTDPEVNAKRGIQVIKDCLRWSENDVGLAMACYNGGPGLIYRDPINWPDESKRYYTWGGGIFNDAQRGLSKSETLDAWLAAGGQGLCDKAAEALGLGPGQTVLPRPTNQSVPPTLTLQLPTLANVDPNQIPTRIPDALPTFAVPTNTPPVKLFLTPEP